MDLVGLFIIIFAVLPFFAFLHCERVIIHAHVAKHIGIYLIAAVIIFPAVMFLSFWNPPANCGDDCTYYPDFIRDIILGVGGFGAVYGLVLASRRQQTFSDQIKALSKQVDTGQEQLFNEQLSRGIEQLGKEDNVAMRRAGVRLLEKLAKSMPDKEEQVIEMMHDYIVASSPLHGFHDTEILDRHERMDLELAIVLVTARARAAKVDMTSIPFRNLNLSRLEFVGENFERANFAWSNLGKAEFAFCNLNDANFERIYGWDARFGSLTLRNANFTNATLTDATLHRSDLTGVNFDFSILKKTNFFKADCSGTDFEHVADFSPINFGDIIFYCDNPPKMPEGIDRPEHRAYTIEKYKGRERKRFIESDADCSLQWVDEYSEF